MVRAAPVHIGLPPVVEKIYDDGVSGKQVVATDKDGARLSPGQLAEAGVAPGESAVVEIRPYTEDEWVAEAQDKTLSSAAFIEHLRRAPGA
jgi:hypothetical protein